MPTQGISAAAARAIARAAAAKALEEAKQYAGLKQRETVGYGKKQLSTAEQALKKSLSATVAYAEETAAKTKEEIGEKMFEQKAPTTPTKRKTIFTSKEARDLTKDNLKFFYSLYK